MPTTPNVINASFGSILAACRQRLIDMEVIGEDRVFLVARDRAKIEHFQGLNDVLLRPGSFTVEEGWTKGGGRIQPLFRRTMFATIRTYLNRDQSAEETYWITATDGHMALEEGVVNYLHLFTALDADNNHIVIEPIRVLGGDMPDKETDDMAWGYSVLRFEVAYFPPMDQNEQ